MNHKSLLTVLFLGLTLSLSSRADVKFKCNAELEEYARELVEMELSGFRAPQKSSCLKQNKFKHVRVAHDPINELINQKFYYANPKTLIIDQVKKVHEKKKHYRVEFTIQAGESATAMSTKRDSLIFFQNDDESWGCAHLLFPPENIYVAPHCL